MKILIIRNDKLGDFTLALPAFALLKKSLPDAEITVFAPSYTAPIAGQVSYIDEVLIDNNESALRLSEKFKKFDVLICLYSSKRVALAGAMARVPYRLAPATKWWQFFYNHRLVQRRSRSEKPEFEYNLDIVRFFLKDQNIPVQEVSVPYLKATGTTQESNLVIVHPGTGGSANNLSLVQYAELVKLLAASAPTLQFLITAGPNEEDQANILLGLLNKNNISCKVWLSTKGLTPFIRKLSSAEIFIGGSTGPLHLAGALNIKTVGFYPNKRSATALRWQTLNETDKRLAFSPKDGSDDMAQVDLKTAAKTIYSEFLSG